jgi:hypothetical protein
VAFEIGEVSVVALLADDAAKLNPNLFPRNDQARLLSRKLSLLAARQRVPATAILLRPRSLTTTNARPVYFWFDQLFDAVGPHTLFNWGKKHDRQVESPVWSNLLSFWGDRRIDLRRANVDVLETVLEDFQPGLAVKILAVRPADRRVDFRATALIAVPAEIREQVASRLTFNAHRYSLDIETAVKADRRRWYVAAEIQEDKISVLHRSQLTW